jgi:urease accessory protein
VDWTVLHLADSAFPAGAFAHSSGLEAALHHGEIASAAQLRGFLDTSLWQAGQGALPLLNAAYQQSHALAELDGICDAFISNHVANRASRGQGRAFISACERCFPSAELSALRQHIREQRLCMHIAPVFGAVLREMHISLESSQQLYLFLQLRGMVSAAVRLNIIGPYQGQQMQFSSTTLLNEIQSACAALFVEDLAQPAPLLDVFQMAHDRLYSRLFQS